LTPKSEELYIAHVDAVYPEVHGGLVAAHVEIAVFGGEDDCVIERYAEPFEDVAYLDGCQEAVVDLPCAGGVGRGVRRVCGEDWCGCLRDLFCPVARCGDAYHGAQGNGYRQEYVSLFAEICTKVIKSCDL
jgi:hypothetical protein